MGSSAIGILTSGNGYSPDSMTPEPWKQVALPETSHQKVRSSLEPCHHAYGIHVTSPHQVGMLSSHVVTGEGWAPCDRCFEREKDSIWINFILVDHYNCLIVLSVIVVTVPHLLFFPNWLQWIFPASRPVLFILFSSEPWVLFYKIIITDFLAVQRWRLPTSSAGGIGSISGWGSSMC